MSAPAEQRELAPERVARLLEEGSAQVVDVRTHAERTAGHVPGSLHLPFDELSGRAEELDPSRPVVFYCRGGDRSSLAAQALAASGREALSMTGGLAAWAAQGLPLEPADGRVAEGSGLPPA